MAGSGSLSGVEPPEHLFLFVRDRRADLQQNLNASVERIRKLVEVEAA